MSDTPESGPSKGQSFPSYSGDFKRPTPDKLAEYRAGDIKENVNESLNGNDDLHDKEVLNFVKLAKEQGVLDKVATKIEQSGAGTVIRDKATGEVSELRFDNDNPYDDIKVDVKIDGDKITVNNKDESQLSDKEMKYMEKLLKAVVEHPQRRLSDGSSLTPVEQKTTLELETALLKGDFAKLKKLVPELLNDPSKDRILEAVNRDFSSRGIEIQKNAQGEDCVVIQDKSAFAALINAKGETQVYKDTIGRGEAPRFQEIQPGDWQAKYKPTAETVVRENGERLVSNLRDTTDTYRNASVVDRSKSLKAPERIADHLITSRQSVHGY